MKRLGALCAVLLMAIGSVAWAGDAVLVPHLMNLQSLIYDSDGNLSKSDTVDLAIRILDEKNNVIFSENQNAVPVVNGAVNISVGSNEALSLDALDPATGQKFLDISVGGESPFDLMPLVAVPYALWAEKALTVANDSIGSEQIKNGSIKIEDLEDGISFSDLKGQASDGQIPSSIATTTQLNAHINSTTAHQASAIVVSSNFSNFVASNVLEALQKIDAKLAEEIVNRSNMNINSLPGILNETKIDQTIARDSEVLTIINNLPAGQTIDQSHIDPTIMRDSEADANYVNVTGDTINGDLQVNGNVGVTGTVDGYDVSGTFNDHENRISKLEMVRPFAMASLVFNGGTGHYDIQPGSYNVSSAIGTTFYAGVTFQNAASSANYIVMAIYNGDVGVAASPALNVRNKTASGFEIHGDTNVGSGSIMPGVDVVVFGN